MTFQTIPLDNLPKRERAFDQETASALLAATKNDPKNGATDGIVYATEPEARKEATKHKRLLGRVAPSGMTARSRVFTVNADGKPDKDGKSFAWAVLLGKANAKKSAKA